MVNQETRNMCGNCIWHRPGNEKAMVFCFQKQFSVYELSLPCELYEPYAEPF